MREQLEGILGAVIVACLLAMPWALWFANWD